MLYVGRVVMGICRNELGRGFDLQRGQPREKVRKVLCLWERQEIEIQPVSGGIDLQDGVSQITVRWLAQRHFEGGQSLSAGTIFPFLSQLNKCLPRSVGVLSIAVAAHFPFYLKEDRYSLLYCDLANISADGKTDFETHTMRFCPNPDSINDVDLVVGLVGMSLLVEYWYVLETDRHELA